MGCLLEAGLSPAAPAEPSFADKPGAVSMRSFGDYELLEEIARGGMGVVYRARQISLNRFVAVKMILGGQLIGVEALRRFRQEAEAAAQLKHPHIVAIHEVGEHDGQPYFSMDCVDGLTLRQLTRDNPLSAPRAARYLRTIAEAVHYAHEQGIVHRDLKPSNVLIDAVGQPHVSDFGLAKRLGSGTDLTLSGAAMGTPGYMPPEQASGGSKTASPLADVYALGAMLYDLLTGRPPHRAETPLETLAQTVNQEPVSPRLLNASIPRDLETICLKCLEKEPARRYGSARAMADDLACYLNHEPIRAVPPGAFYRARKFIRRHWVGVAVAACFVAVLVGATVVSVMYGLRATQAEAQALTSAQTARASEELVKKRVIEVAAERDEKEKARQEAESFSTFLTEVFQSPDPARDGRTITVAETLDTAAKRLDTDLATQPFRRAQLQFVLGSTYTSLGLARQAIPLLEVARAYSRSNLGTAHPATYRAMLNLASAYFAAGRWPEALKLREETLVLARSVNGPEHADTLLAQHGVISSYLDAHRIDEALKLAEELLPLTQKVNGREHPQTISAMTTLAVAYGNAGRQTEHLRLFEQVLELRRRIDGPEHPSTLIAMGNLARAYFSAARWDEALRLRAQAMPLYRRVFGPEHPSTLGAIYSLAASYGQAGRRDEALQLHEELLPLHRKVNGPEHPDTLRNMYALASLYDDVGRHEESLKLSEALLPLSRSIHGPEHPETLNAMTILANVCARSNRPEDALRLRAEVLPLRRKINGPEHRYTLGAMTDLGISLGRAGRLIEAIDLLEKSVAIKRRVFPPGNPYLEVALENLADLYGKAGRPAEALALQKETLESLQAAYGLKSKRILGAMRNLALAYMAASRWAEAEPVLKDELAIRREQFPVEHADTLAAMCSLAETQIKLGRISEAEALLQACRPVLERTFPGRTVTLNACSLAGEVLLAQKRFSDAEPLLVQSIEQLLARESANPGRGREIYRQAAGDRILQLYEAWGKPDEATRWRKKLSRR